MSVAAALACAAFAPDAQAAFPSLFAGKATCAAQPANGNVRVCGGTTTTWDGTKIEVEVILPPQPGSGGDGPYPTIGNFHGWGGEKIGLNPQTQGWAERGYAVLSMSDRGWGKSCGGEDPERLPVFPACAHGYNHLMDDRYEVRDAQYLLGVLADEGVAQPQRIGATGMSYGGGISMALAALRDRTMLPDGSLVAWTSPGGKPMALAAAVPQWPWTDLAYSLMPNGRTLDYVADAPYLGPDGTAPIGVEKASFVAGLFGVGQVKSNYAAPGTDPGADLVNWYARINAGEPYDGDPTAAGIVAEITAHHSSYYIDHSEPPAPLLIQSGWNDDLFPPDEAIRFYNRTRTQYPGDPISLYFMDDGHARSQNKAADVAAFEVRQNAWFDHYLKGIGPAPSSSVETLTTTCPTTAPSAGPYRAASWSTISPGEIRLVSPVAQTIVPGSGDPSAGTAFDPIASGKACATANGADAPGVANYRLGPVPGAGFTLMGSPTIVADVASPGPASEIAARLLDVAPNGQETLVARALYRPGAGGPRRVFQLHPQGYRFAPGDTAKLELLPADQPYGRASNAQAQVTVSNLELRLPVIEQPGALGGLVGAPAPKVLPPGYRLAAGYTESVAGGGGTPLATSTAGVAGVAGPLRATRRRLIVPLRCYGGACSGSLTLRAGRGKGANASAAKRRARRALARGSYSLAPGRRVRLSVPLTRAGRRLVAARLAERRRTAKLRARLEVLDSGRSTPIELGRAVRLPGSKRASR